MRISNEEKLACVRRELTMRRNVYARRIAAGHMMQALADREIRLMEAIVDDYEELAKGDRLL